MENGTHAVIDTIYFAASNVDTVAVKHVQGYESFIMTVVILWSLFIIGLIGVLAWKYPLSDKWTIEKPNPFRNETLGIPRGTLRGIITITLLFIFILWEVISWLSGMGENPGLTNAVQLMLAFYFGSKVMHHMTSVEKSKSQEITRAVATSQQAETGSFHDPDAVG